MRMRAKTVVFLSTFFVLELASIPMLTASNVVGVQAGTWATYTLQNFAYSGGTTSGGTYNGGTATFEKFVVTQVSIGELVTGTEHVTLLNGTVASRDYQQDVYNCFSSDLRYPDEPLPPLVVADNLTVGSIPCGDGLPINATKSVTFAGGAREVFIFGWKTNRVNDGSYAVHTWEFDKLTGLEISDYVTNLTSGDSYYYRALTDTNAFQFTAVPFDSSSMLYAVLTATFISFYFRRNIRPHLNLRR